ncbi:MAG TPA: cell wall hydrolase [Caulobacteraceae bacterium]
MNFTFSPHAKACAQVGAPLAAAAMGLTVAAIVCSATQPRFPGQNVDTSRLVQFASSTPAATPAVPMDVAPTNQVAQLPAAPAWTRRARGQDLDCLSKAVYYEARGESAAGQAAVAQVVLNRAHNPAYPKNVCAVVFQPASDGGCQFSFVCDGAMARPLEPMAWRRAREVAARALRGYVMAAVGRALNFHSAYASADAAAGTPVARLGNHVFFIAASRPVAGHSGGGVRHLARTAPATVEEGPAGPDAARRLTMALGDLGLFGKSAGPLPASDERVASAGGTSAGGAD